jgi:hypothetical protein
MPDEWRDAVAIIKTSHSKLTLTCDSNSVRFDCEHGMDSHRRAAILVIVDRDNLVFSIEGPMNDDTRWIKAVLALQEKGRGVTCSTPGDSAMLNDITVDMAARGFSNVPSRAIVQPKI